jgi:transposase-like protein
MTTNFNSFAAMLTALPTDNDCREYLELKRWNGTPVCPHCGVIDTNHYKLNVKGEFKGLYKCKSCKQRFTVLLGTMFEGSPISLRKWFIGTFLFSAHKKGVSSHQLARDLGVTQKTAWFMLHRLRLAFTDINESPLGGGGNIVEADSTVVGGKVKNMNNRKRKEIAERKRGAYDNKTNVAGFIERNGNIRFDVIDGNEKESELVKKHVDTDTLLMTDTGINYKAVGRDYLGHEMVDHSKSEYVREKVIHTNTIEGAFSHFDRMVMGTYHSLSPKHLQAYCNELGFRYNNRKITDKMRFDMALMQTSGAMLNYKTLIAK